MGYGVRDESDETRIWFATTGYLVQFLSRSCKEITHLIIDEVHQRSLDADLCCYLTRELSKRNPNLRIVLMSATLDAQIYRDYFTNYQWRLEPGDSALSQEVEALFVGVRRYPVEIFYLEDLVKFSGEGMQTKNEVMKKLIESCHSIEQSDNHLPKPALITAQYDLAIHLIRTIATLGTAVLVFVSGIADIDHFVAYFEGYSRRYRLVCIHSQIPLEQQEEAFSATSPDEIKVIVATNSAESSITLSDVDLVICLGRENVLSYNQELHRTEIVSSMITQASATQRAGRTGRVRPGRVFRLYTKTLYESLRAYGDSEVLRVPLDDLILKLRSLLEESSYFRGVVPILADLPDPPALRNISQSFDHLFHCGLITDPSDDGALTAPGRFLSHLGVDIRLGRFLIYGIMLGIVNEAVIIAAALQLPQTPFSFPSPYVIKDHTLFNSWRQKTFLKMTEFDEGSYSEPIMLLNVYLSWSSLSLEMDRTKAWCQKNSLDFRLFRQWIDNVKNLRRNLIQTLGARPASQSYPKHILWNLIRVCFVWCGEDNILRMNPIKAKKKCYSTQMSFEGSDPLIIAKICELIPEGMKYKVYTPQPLISYELTSIPLDLLREDEKVEQIIETSFRVTLSHNLKFTLLLCEVDSVVHLFFFIQKCEIEDLTKDFLPNALSEGIEMSLINDWVCIEFIDPSPQLLASISLMGLGVRQLRATFDLEGASIVTNGSAQIVEDLLLGLDLNPASAKSRKLTKNEKMNKTEIVFSDPNPSSALFEDVPLGIRLFNCLIRGRKEQ
jgi:HrpA-like RNA helicase